MAIHDGHRDRIREKIIKGALDGFHDHEILEFILFHAIPMKDTNDIAHRLIDEFGSFSAVLDSDVERLTAVSGMTRNAAILLTTLPFISRKYQSKNDKQTISLRNLECVKEYILSEMSSLTREELRIICKDSAANLIYCGVLAKGTVSEVNLFKRELVDMAMRHKAVSVIIAHNHPSKTCQPSPADIRLTQEAAIAVSMVNIIFDDHVIVAGNEIFSFKQNGLLEKITNSEIKLTFKEGSLTDIKI